MAFKDNLKAYRKDAGYTAKDFAKELGIAYTTYLTYENQGREPKYDILMKIADLLNVSIDDLLGYEIKPFSKLDAAVQYFENIGYTITKIKNDKHSAYFIVSTCGIKYNSLIADYKNGFYFGKGVTVTIKDNGFISTFDLVRRSGIAVPLSKEDLILIFDTLKAGEYERDFNHETKKSNAFNLLFLATVYTLRLISRIYWEHPKPFENEDMPNEQKEKKRADIILSLYQDLITGKEPLYP